MTRRVLVTVAALPLLAAVEVWRRGLAAPVLFGFRQHCRARPDWRYQPEVVG